MEEGEAGGIQHDESWILMAERRFRLIEDTVGRGGRRLGPV